ncbi:hypothetical protein F5Y16DRAFT_396428 [Xylariaceae sp. FL0255]|nr:hypothetical protein F5Y16DRAFT_396428 [Xylariaceae sp. FL0255]
MPLVPEPFKGVVVSRQAVFLRSQPEASQLCQFCPSLNIPEYRESLSDEKKKSLDEKTSRLTKRAINHHHHESSEFGWEVTGWHDVFGAILEDDSFRIDKRPYEFVEKDEKEATVKRRIPDATFGLKTYDDYDLERDYICNVDGCNVDHSHMQPDRMLSRDDLSAMMHDATCGLIVDGVWGKTNLVFPFAVYEAKKRSASYEAAEEQIFHACRTYLAMLDDLARDPNDVTRYQSNESAKYQMFALTSCASYWQVFIAWKHLDTCYVETIWEGDVKIWKHAFDLICIVDQIHDYAAHQHRPYVTKHLDAWHAKHHKALEPTRSCISANDRLVESYEFAENTKLFEATKQAAWMQLKEDTRKSRLHKAMLTRQKNKRLRELAQIQETKSESNKKPKRGRGRPPKIHGIAKKNDTTRRPGRPPKTSYARSRKGKGTF